MKRLAVCLVVVVLGLIIGWSVFGDSILIKVGKSYAKRNMTGEVLAELPDGLHLVLCGAGAPLPDPTRAGACVLVLAGQDLYVVDVGSGSPRNFAPMGIPAGRVNAVFLTHFHSDHFDGLGELMTTRWAGGAHKSALPVHGPEGVQQVVNGLNMAYAQDFEYRIAHHGETVTARSGAGASPQPFRLPKTGEGHRVLEHNGLVVTAFAVEHAPVSPAVGYRFDYKGRSLVISGDTKKSTNLIEFSRSVDLLVHEALAPHVMAIIGEAAEEAGAKHVAKIAIDVLDYHTTPVEAAEVASEANVGHLLFYHLVPPLPARPMEKFFLKGTEDAFAGDMTIGRDGTMISLPANSKAIETGSLL